MKEKVFNSIEVNLSKYGDLGKEIGQTIRKYEKLSLSTVESQNEFIDVMCSYLKNDKLSFEDKIYIVDYLSMSPKNFQSCLTFD